MVTTLPFATVVFVMGPQKFNQDVLVPIRNWVFGQAGTPPKDLQRLSAQELRPADGKDDRNRRPQFGANNAPIPAAGNIENTVQQLRFDFRRDPQPMPSLEGRIVTEVRLDELRCVKFTAELHERNAAKVGDVIRYGLTGVSPAAWVEVTVVQIDSVRLTYQIKTTAMIAPEDGQPARVIDQNLLAELRQNTKSRLAAAQSQLANLDEQIAPAEVIIDFRPQEESVRRQLGDLTSERDELRQSKIQPLLQRLEQLDALAIFSESFLTHPQVVVTITSHAEPSPRAR